MDWLGVDRQRLGSALVAFGIVGLALAVLAALTLVAAGASAVSLDARLTTGQDQISASLDGLTATLDSVASSVDHGATTLGTSKDAVTHAVDVLGQVADTSDALAAALDLDLFGQRPFTGAVGSLHDLSTRVRAFQGDATKLASNLDQNTADAAQIASEIRDMRSQVADLSTTVSGLGGARDLVTFAVVGIVLAALMTAWLGVLAAAILWAGSRLRRGPRPGLEGVAVSVSVAPNASLPGATRDRTAGPADEIDDEPPEAPRLA